MEDSNTKNGGKGGEEEIGEIMPLKERQVTLSKLARRKDFGRGFHGRGVIEAIEALNKIDGIYKQTVTVEHEVIHTFVFMLPDGTKFTPGLLPERTLTTSESTISPTESR